MKKVFIALIAMIACVTMASAQTAIEEQKVFDNTYAGAEIGVSSPIARSVFPLNTNFGVKLGKNFSPVFGVNVEGIAFLGSNAVSNTRFSYHNSIRAINVGVNGTVDMFNLFGYNPNRVFTIIPEVGIGWLHGFNNNSDFNSISAKTAIQAAFNVKKAWQLYVEPGIFWNLGNQKFNRHHAQMGVQVGFLYKFKTSNGAHNFKRYDIGAMNDEINDLRAQLAAKPKTVVETHEVVKEVVKTHVVRLYDTVIMFAYKSAELSDEARNELDKVIGAVEVYGYASPEGTKDFNQKLSQQRADAVAEYLVSRGVAVTKCVGCGVNGETSNRVVIVKH